MAPLAIKIKASPTDIFDAEVESDETVETLAMLIFSLRPDLGEDLRLVHSGKILKPQEQLNLKSGDTIVVAKAPKAPAATPAPTPAPPAAAAQPELPVCPDATAPPAAAAAPADLKFDPPVRSDDGEPKKKSPRLEAASDPSPVADAVPAAASAEVEPAAAAPTLPLPLDSEALERQVTPTSAPGSPSKVASAPATPSYPEVDAATPAGLIAFAALVEGSTGPPPPEKMAELLRESAMKMAALENTVKELAQGLQMTNMISATCLRGLGASEASAASEDASPTASEGSRSFLIKKGDHELQEKHQAVCAPQYTEGGGTLSSTPTSKEEMQKARQARLEKLELQQKEKQKEKDVADERSKARDSMFTRRDEGKSKPLGRP